MKKIDGFGDLEEPLWSIVVMRAGYDSYIDMDDPENANINIVRYVQGNNIFIECDAWIPFQFKHFFDPNLEMTATRSYHNSSFPKGLYYRVVTTNSYDVNELIHFPSGVVLR